MKNMDLAEKTLGLETIFEGKIIKLQKAEVLLPNGNTSTREVIRHPGAVGIVALLDGNIIMVKQYRYALSQVTLEIPAGKIDPGEKPEDCAVRELREETGYEGEVSYLGAFHTAPGFADETIHLYLARNLKWSPLKADDDEFINVERISWPEALQMAVNGEIEDAKSVLGILLTEKRN